MRIKILLPVVIFGILLKSLQGQDAPVTSLPNISCDPGTIIDIPITVSDFNNIGAFSLTLHYEDSVLNYQSFTNNSGFPTLMINGTSAGQITAGGLNFAGPGITLPDNSVLFTLTFLCEDGFTDLVWYDDGGSCEYTDDLYNPLNDYPACSFYQGGSVNDNSFQLQLKAYLEGAYYNGEMSTQLKEAGFVPTTQPYSGSPWNYGGSEYISSIPQIVVDWVLVELRESAGDASTATPDKVIARKAGFLLKNGSIKYMDDCSSSNMTFSVSISNNLYVVIYHRNHIAAISANPVPIFNGSGVYNFSLGENKALGGSLGHKEIAPGVWGLATGDSNGDGLINDTDKQNDWEEVTGNRGYLSSDFSFDSQVNNADKNDCWKLNVGFETQVPD